MLVIEDILQKSDLPKDGIITIGNFDGLHLGQQKLIEITLNSAKNRKAPSLLLTFYPHPRTILEKGRFKNILTREEKLEKIEQLGIDYYLEIKFDYEFLKHSASWFVEELLIQRLKPQKIVIGENFKFGNKREGNAIYLKSFCENFNIEVEIVELVTREGSIVSSSLIRTLIENGEIKKANYFLGYPYPLGGKVFPLLGRGNKIGYPTANISPEKDLHPKIGVYAGAAKYKNTLYPAAINIGTRPTFEDTTKEPIIEAFILNFAEDIRGKYLKLFFLERLRDEKRFGSIKELLQQIYIDVKKTREIFGRQANYALL